MASALGAALALAACNQSPTPTNSAAPASSQSAAQSAARVDSSQPVQVGRYTIIHSPEVERDTMLLDTATGQTWQLVDTGTTAEPKLAWAPVHKLPSD